MLYNLARGLADQFILANLFRYITFRSGAACLTALFLSFVLGPFVIRWLKRVQNGTFLSQNDPLVRARSMSQFEASGSGYDFPRRFELDLLQLNAEAVRAAAARWFTHSVEASIIPVRSDSNSKL